MAFTAARRALGHWHHGGPLLLLLSLALLTATAAGPSLHGAAGLRQATPTAPGGRPIRALFLGHEQPTHNSHVLFPLLAAPLARRGIQMTHVDTPAEALTPEALAPYDAIVIYGNHRVITPEQEQALVDFVERGKGLVAIHSASFMFTEAERYIPMVGGQFLRHGTGEFSAEIVAPDHPIMAGFENFTTWDETYVHTRHNPDRRTVLMERVDDEGREPYTWVRTEGRGRVFYTAFGHDQRTWSNPGFHELITRGLAWAVGDDVASEWRRAQMPEVQYVDGYNIPNYENRDPAPRYQLPFSPADAQKFMQTRGEFDIQLFASEPDIIKPIFFTFDERGRLWAIETLDYPNVVTNGAPGRDRIKILEDTDGDGRADKVTVFADGLNIPTSLVFANGGVIVSAMPDFLFLQDTDGDDRADVRRPLVSGWGNRDTHAGPSNLIYAPDNHIWGVVGYSGYEGTVDGRDLRFSQAAYRFRPDGTSLEHLTNTTNNTWGLAFSETFDVFGSTANNDQSWHMAIPNRYFEGIEGLPGRGGPGYQSLADFYALHPTTPYIRQVDVQGGYTAAAGHRLYTARAFPPEYWNRVAFINEPTAHLVARGIIESQGAGFATRDGWNLVSSAEEWFAPVHAEVGPDGAVWIADWYNFIVQHNPTPPGYENGAGNAYDSPLRDHERGRIYRIAPAGAAPAAPRVLSKTDPAGLVAALSDDNMFWRLQAQRLIVERGGTDLVPDLVALTRDRRMDAIGISAGPFHALWALEGLGLLSSLETDAGRAAVDALRHPAAGVRKAAVMVLPRTAAAARAVLAAGLLQDPDLHTRLAAVLVMSEMPQDDGIGAALYDASRSESNFTDRWLGRAVYIAATRHQDAFLARYEADPERLPFSSLPVPLRIGNLKPDWRQPSEADLATEWRDIRVPGAWETRGLPDFDGVVWFSRTFDWSGSDTVQDLSLGSLRNSGEVWLNGVLVTPPPGRGRGRGAGAGMVVPSGVVREGSNTITVRIQNNRNEGGFLGQPGDLFVAGSAGRVSLSGTWRYRVERQTNAGGLYTRPGELAAHVAFTAGGGLDGAAGATLPPVAAPTPDVVLALGVVPGQMSYNARELTVAPGQLVEIIFTNSDEMPHNVVLGAAGSLNAIGAAADALAQDPANAPTLQYIPEIAQVIVAMPMVQPGQSTSIQFRAPTEPGQYPYVCTFPAHWRLMNGVLNVVEPGGRGRGGQ